MFEAILLYFCIKAIKKQNDAAQELISTENGEGILNMYSRLRNKHRGTLNNFGLFSRGYVPY